MKWGKLNCSLGKRVLILHREWGQGHLKKKVEMTFILDVQAKQIFVVVNFNPDLYHFDDNGI